MDPKISCYPVFHLKYMRQEYIFKRQGKEKNMYVEAKLNMVVLRHWVQPNDSGRLKNTKNLDKWSLLFGEC